jgi:hypothetical protein
MAARKRKITKAHMRALQAGRKRYQKEQKAKTNPKKRAACNPPKKRRNSLFGKPPRMWHKTIKPKRRRNSDDGSHFSKRRASMPGPWWIFDKGGQHCQYGQGSKTEALHKAKQIANKIGKPVGVWGPYPNYGAAYDGCN